MIEGFAHVAAQSDDPEHAAILLGASAARHQSGGFLLEGREQLEAGVRSDLDQERFETAFAEGQAMSPDAAIEHALTMGRS